MKHYDNHDIENKLNELGYHLVCGTDEVGRGPLVGPVVAAAVIMPEGLEIEGVTDSKKVSLKNRLILDKIIKEKAIAYSICFIDNNKIDEINILEASRLAMTTAINDLKVKPDYIVADAMELPIDIPQQSLIKGDAKSFSIACASIIAKVARDNYMDVLDEQYPMYGFKKNNGYPTKQHMEAIKQYGILDLHRKSFSPVAKQAKIGNYYKEAQ